jgi:4-diphosphocytidyl-2-C-methyl-D-erythritol kinase
MKKHKVDTMQLTVECPAKINIFLQITGKRSDGYHNIDTVFLPVPDISDKLTITETETPGITLSCNNAPDVPTDETNLVYKAAQRFAETAGIKPSWSIELTKHIPAAAGMGGGSSDAANVLSVLNRHYNHTVNSSVLHQLATDLGADVPFFLESVPAHATGIGEQLTPVDIRMPLPFLIINPGVPVHTGWAYQAYSQYDRSTATVNHILTALKHGDLYQVGESMHNDFEPCVKDKFPIIALLLEDMQQAKGCFGACLCGSGSTVIALFDNTAAADLCRKQLATKHGKNAFTAWSTILGNT